MSVALPGIIAFKTILPVIGVPVDNNKNFLSLDSLFSVVQMPEGVPVATVAIGKTRAVNVAILAIQIISISNDYLKKT
jgi:5-(carboxyamino)imidazole ribonucleotide mutase